MANFDTTVTETAEKLRTLLEEADRVQASVVEVREQLSQVSETVEADWAELSDRANSLLDWASNAKAELTTKAEQDSQTLVEMKNTVETLRGEVEQELEATKTAIAALDEQIEALTPELEAKLQEVEDSLTSLKDKTGQVEIEIEEALAQTENYLLNEVNNELITHQADLEQRAAALQAYIAEECIPEITERVTEFAEHLEQVVEKLTAKLQHLGDSTEESAQESLNQVTQSQSELFDELMSNTHQLEQLMDKLSNTIDTTSSSVFTAKDTLVDGVKTTNVGLETAIGLLNDVRDILSL